MKYWEVWWPLGGQYVWTWFSLTSEASVVLLLQVINISSPNTPGLRKLQGRKQLKDLVKKVCSCLNWSASSLWLHGNLYDSHWICRCKLLGMRCSGPKMVLHHCSWKLHQTCLSRILRILLRWLTTLALFCKLVYRIIKNLMPFLNVSQVALALRLDGLVGSQFFHNLWHW